MDWIYTRPLRRYRRFFGDSLIRTKLKRVDDFINQLPKAGLRYFRLAVDHEDPDYHHEMWTIHDFFDEYILVNPQQESMWIIVLGYD